MAKSKSDNKKKINKQKYYNKINILIKPSTSRDTKSIKQWRKTCKLGVINNIKLKIKKKKN